MNTFSLKIIACDKVFFEGECQLFIFLVEDGEMAILPHHEPMTTVTEVGEIFFRDTEGKDFHAIASDGFFEFRRNEGIFLAFSVEKPEEIDRKRAEEALDRAREAMQKKQSFIEYKMSEANISRAMARLKGYDKYRPN